MSFRNIVATATVAVCAVVPVLAPNAAFATAADCPNGGTVRFGVEPFESGAKLLPVYTDFANLMAAKLDCKVELFIATSYNAEIEAMRAGKLEIAEFGPLGYVLAHQVAKAEVFATYADTAGKPTSYNASIVTYPGTGIKSLADLKGRSFAYSDPASTSGHLFPATAISKAGIDPDTGIKPLYAGSHTAAFEVIKNHKVDAGEINSSTIATQTLAGTYNDKDFITLWKSEDIPNGPICVYGDLPAGFKARLIKVVLDLDMTQLPQASQDFLKAAQGQKGSKFAPQKDSVYDVIREMVTVMHVDLNKL